MDLNQWIVIKLGNVKTIYVPKVLDRSVELVGQNLKDLSNSEFMGPTYSKTNKQVHECEVNEH